MNVQTMPPPRGTRFVYQETRRAIDEQMRWIDALDTKAGVLLAAGGIIAGVVIASDSPLARAPAAIVAIASTLLLASLILALVAFATRKYETAPNPDALIAGLPEYEEEYLMWRALPDILTALEINESKVGEKAAYLFYSGLGLLLAVAVFGSYYVIETIR